VSFSATDTQGLYLATTEGTLLRYSIPTTVCAACVFVMCAVMLCVYTLIVLYLHTLIYINIYLYINIQGGECVLEDVISLHPKPSQTLSATLLPLSPTSSSPDATPTHVQHTQQNQEGRGEACVDGKDASESGETQQQHHQESSWANALCAQRDDGEDTIDAASLAQEDAVSINRMSQSQELLEQSISDLILTADTETLQKRFAEDDAKSEGKVWVGVLK
jgi:hypothetical protein